MSFLSALSEEEKKMKEAKQLRLRAELAEQVQAKREEKKRAKEEQLKRERIEYEHEMAARGIPISNATTNVCDPPSPLRQNKNKNNTTQMAFATSTPEMTRSFGRPKPFLATLNELHGSPSNTESAKKAKQREILRSRLAEQVRERDQKKKMKEIRAKIEEAREMQTLLDSGLDFWGQPLPPGAPKLELPERLRPYLNMDPSEAMSTEVQAFSTTTSSSAANAASPSAPKPELLNGGLPLPSADGRAYSEIPRGHRAPGPRGLSRASSTAGLSSVSSIGSGSSEQLEELTNLCRQLVEEQRELRQIIDKQGKEILAHKQSKPQRHKNMKSTRSASKDHKRQTRSKFSSGAKQGVGFGSTVPRMVADRGRQKPISPNKQSANQRLQHGKAVMRSTKNRKALDENSEDPCQEYKPSKDDLKKQKERRIKIRLEYAKKTRFRSKAGKSQSHSDYTVSSSRRASDRKHLKHSQTRQRSRAERLAAAESYVDDRPIHGMSNDPSAKPLDSESHMIHNYDRKRDPLKMLASGTGNSPREFSNPGDSTHNPPRSMSGTKKQWRKPAEHFEFKQDYTIE